MTKLGSIRILKQGVVGVKQRRKKVNGLGTTVMRLELLSCFRTKCRHLTHFLHWQSVAVAG